LEIMRCNDYAALFTESRRFATILSAVTSVS
jgi:hypothetical protein